MNQIVKAIGREWYQSAAGYTLRVLRALILRDFNAREQLGLINRPHYAYGTWRAFDGAVSQALRKVTICEFGVGLGGGLLNIVQLAEELTKETGIRPRIVGFDTGGGLSTPRDYRDHPEIWKRGDFKLNDRQAFERKLNGRADMYWGNIRDTLGEFLTSVKPDAPIGFVSIDVDFYSSAVDALRCLTSDSSLYLPAVSTYFDDIEFFSTNSWCGELLALNEFNQAHSTRKIDRDVTLPGGPERPQWQKWYQRMYVAHILDHPSRQSVRLPRDKFQGI